MHALVMTYALNGAQATEHAELCAQLEPAFAAVPQLLSHTWLANRHTGRFGAFFIFADRPAFDAFIASELFAAFHSHAAIRDATTSDYAAAPNGGVTR